MHAYELSYERNVAIRTPTFGGMDSDFSHWELQQQTMTVVVPRDSAFWRQQSEVFLNEYSGNKADPVYRFHGITRSFAVNAILPGAMDRF